MKKIKLTVCVLTVLSLLMSYAVTGSAVDVVGNYPDVGKSAWYYDAVTFCASEGWITGYKNGYFGPTDKIQRQDFVLILSRVAGVNLNKYNPSAATSKFSDVNDKNAYYARALAWGVSAGIVNGYENGKFGVGDPVTREQICVFICRYLNRTGKSVVITAKTRGMLLGFNDSAKVSAFAKDYVAWCVENKVINGTADNYLNPVKSALRCEVAQIFYNADSNGLFGDWMEI